MAVSKHYPAIEHNSKGALHGRNITGNIQSRI